MTEKAAQTIGKGWLVALAGRVEHQTWEKDGQKRGKHRVIASRVEFLAAPRNGDREPDVTEFEPATADDDTLSDQRLADGDARPRRLRPGGRLRTPRALRVWPPGQQPRRGLHRRHPLLGRRGPPGPHLGVRRRAPRHMRLLRLPSLQSSRQPAHMSTPAPQLYVVEINDRCEARLVGHTGCSYASPTPASRAGARARTIAPRLPPVRAARRRQPVAMRNRRRHAHDPPARRPRRRAAPPLTHTPSPTAHPTRRSSTKNSATTGALPRNERKHGFVSKRAV